MYLRLIAAVFWLFLGGTLLAMRWLHPDIPQWRLELAGIPAGWVAIVFALYNLVQLGVAYAMRQRRAEEPATFRTRFRRTSATPPREPDPNFDFTNPPPEDKDHLN